ncbi:MAG TPA: 50S ribosomal protein L10 [Syntrophales bacterium]|nr:50S ribosomal protein L10 [Syntrophales bacterium]
MDRAAKENMVAELREKLKAAKIAILAGYTGMNVAKLTDLRNELRKADSEMRVIKNTLMRIASQGTDYDKLEEHLKGPLALVMNCGDVVEPAKVMAAFAKKNAELDIKVGVLQGKVLTREQLAALAALPSREILLGQLLSVMVGVQTGLVNVLAGVPRKLVQTLAAYRMKKEQEA